MNIQRPSCALAVALIATQVLGPALLWAADQRGIRAEANRRVIVSALSGDQLTMQNGSNTKALYFRDTVNPGDLIATGDRTVAEVLIGNRAVVTLGQGTRAQVTAVSENQATVQVQKGSVRVAASAMALGGQGSITVQTPTSQVQTRGGIIRVMVDAPIGSAEQIPIGAAKPYRASYAPSAIVAAVNTRGDIIQVEEGTAEIPGAGPGGGTLTVKSGQSATLQSGQVGSLSGLANQAGLRVGVLASAGHSKTPKEGLENLVALQVTQATALGKALTGAAETGGEKSGKKDDSKNAINGATGGVALASAFAGTFGRGGPLSGTGGSASDRSGTGAVDDSNDSPVLLSLASVSVSVKGGSGLLLFTERNPKVVTFNNGLDTEDSNYSISQGPREVSIFSATKELLLVDGGDKSLAPHGGNAPISTLIARGISVSNEVLPIQVRGSFGSIAAADGTVRPVAGRVELTAANAQVVISQTESEISQSRDIFNNSLDRALSTVPIVDASLSDFSNNKSGYACENCSGAVDQNGNEQSGLIQSLIDGVVAARSALTGNRTVDLTGGVVLDKETTVSLGRTDATHLYFNGNNVLSPKSGLGDPSQDRRFTGSLLAVLASQDGGFNPAFVKIQDRALGVLDGSSISGTGGNVALLSVLDSRLTGPTASDPSVRTNKQGLKEIKESAPLMELDWTGRARPLVTDSPAVTVTSAVVVRSTDVELDGALLSASSPLLAMMNASMKTTSHFADLAGKTANNPQHALVASLVPGDALVRLNNSSILTIQGNLLNLNNATASLTGYLFSLDGGSTLSLNSSTPNLNNGMLFSLNNGSVLTLNGSLLNSNAFGVFGNSGVNTLSITNGLCAATCGQLVNSAGQPFLVNGGTPLQVAGVTQNVVLPNSFTPFALAPGASTSNVQINITATDALFHIDGTSTLTINGTKVQ